MVESQPLSFGRRRSDVVVSGVRSLPHATSRMSRRVLWAHQRQRHILQRRANREEHLLVRADVIRQWHDDSILRRP